MTKTSTARVHTPQRCGLWRSVHSQLSCIRAHVSLEHSDALLSSNVACTHEMCVPQYSNSQVAELQGNHFQQSYQCTASRFYQQNLFSSLLPRLRLCCLQHSAVATYCTTVHLQLSPTQPHMHQQNVQFCLPTCSYHIVAISDCPGLTSKMFLMSIQRSSHNQSLPKQNMITEVKEIPIVLNPTHNIWLHTHPSPLQTKVTLRHMPIAFSPSSLQTPPDI